MSKGGKREYQVGKFWLGREDESSSWYIYWYDARKRKTRRKTTHEESFERAKDLIDEHYYASRTQIKAAPVDADIRKILSNYWLEHGRTLTAAQVINSAILSFTKFIDLEEDTGRVTGLTMLSDLTPRYIRRYIAWRLTHSIRVVHNEEGEVVKVLTSKKDISPNTVQTYVKYIRAAINWAYKNGDISICPYIPGLSRYELNGPRTAFISIEMMANALTYAHTHKMDYLFKFIICSIGTIARPQTVLELHVGSQMDWTQGLLDLNPLGRRMTSKRRPVVAVPELLEKWLKKESGYFVQYNNDQVKSIKKSWRTMRAELKWPTDIITKTIRHSVAKTLRTNSALKKKYGFIIDPWELSGHMGHQAAGGLEITEGYAQYVPDTESTVIQGLNAYFKELEQAVDFDLHPKCTQKSENEKIDIQEKTCQLIE